jgi:hypothetical protein
VEGFHDGEQTIDRSTVTSHRQSENRESHGHKHRVIMNTENPMEVLATVTQRQVIWIVF